MGRKAAAEPVRWLALIPRVPSEPSRHRVAVWRELRRAGAVQLGQGTWALPDGADADAVVDKIVALAEQGAGEVLVLAVDGRSDTDRQRLRAVFDEARTAEWDEFGAECDKALAELRREIEQRKFTLAELDEEEQNVERLRRWHRELTVRDRFGAGAALDVHARLERCTAELARFTELVYEAVGLG